MSQADFYRTNAANAAHDAETTSLPHVRERCLRSQSAWLAMAERFEQAEIMSAKRVAEQVERKRVSEEAMAHGV